MSTCKLEILFKLIRYDCLKAMLVIALLLVCILFGGCSNRENLTHDEDELISYLQSVSSICSQLKLEFEGKSNMAGPSGLVLSSNVDPVDASEVTCGRALSHQQSLRAMDAESRQRLCQSNAQLVQAVKASCAQLKSAYAKKPKVLAKDWDRYWQAISYSLEL